MLAKDGGVAIQDEAAALEPLPPVSVLATVMRQDSQKKEKATNPELRHGVRDGFVILQISDSIVRDELKHGTKYVPMLLQK
jgi:hypothetical protein